jgi:hypothetical protein
MTEPQQLIPALQLAHCDPFPFFMREIQVPLRAAAKEMDDLRMGRAFPILRVRNLDRLPFQGGFGLLVLNLQPSVDRKKGR